MDLTSIINIIIPIVQLFFGGLIVYYLTKIDRQKQNTIRLGNYSKQLNYSMHPCIIAYQILSSNPSLTQEYLQNNLTSEIINKTKSYERIALTQIDTTLKEQDVQLWRELDKYFSILPVSEYERLFKFFTVTRPALNNLLKSKVNLTHPKVKELVKISLVYIQYIDAYLSYLTEEGTKKYYHYLPCSDYLPKKFKFTNKYKVKCDELYTQLLTLEKTLFNTN